MTSAKGCRKCNGCLNGPVRGNYDGLVVLCAVTKETLPNVGTTVSAASNVNRCLLTEQLTVNSLLTTSTLSTAIYDKHNKEEIVNWLLLFF
jgi:hypothetical protein